MAAWANSGVVVRADNSAAAAIDLTNFMMTSPYVARFDAAPKTCLALPAATPDLLPSGKKRTDAMWKEAFRGRGLALCHPVCAGERWCRVTFVSS